LYCAVKQQTAQGENFGEAAIRKHGEQHLCGRYKFGDASRLVSVLQHIFVQECGKTLLELGITLFSRYKERESI